jgi:hypothetical protein
MTPNSGARRVTTMADASEKRIDDALTGHFSAFALLQINGASIESQLLNVALLTPGSNPGQRATGRDRSTQYPQIFHNG